MPQPPGRPPTPHERARPPRATPHTEAGAEPRYRPLALLGIVVVTLLGFAVFFVSFLLAPIAILAFFYFMLAIQQSSKRKRQGAAPEAEPAEDTASRTRLEEEATARQRAIERIEREEALANEQAPPLEPSDGPHAGSTPR